MRDPYQYPKLRWPIDLRMENIDGQELLYINCPIGVSKNPLFLVAAVAPIVACFEGQLSVDEITSQFQPYGIPKELIEKLVSLLDENHFLESPRFFAAEKNIRDEFLQASVRQAALAGSSYSNSASELQATIEKYLQEGASAHATDASAIQAQTPAQKFAEEAQAKYKNLVALISPHIDYRRGHACYGMTYSKLPRNEHDLFILIGTAHQYSKQLFNLTAKHFETPLGQLQCDSNFVSKLASAYGADRSFADEFLHKREHSLELQTPFLKQLSPNAKIAPILMGSFYPFLQRKQRPEECEEYQSFVVALCNCIKDELASGKRICLIAGVDMAHVGKNFGNKDALTPEFMQLVAKQDRLFLQSVLELNKHKLYDHVAADGDARRICGFPIIYCLLDVLNRLGQTYKTQIFDYRQAVDYKTDCAVTFAGAGVYAENWRLA